jgi:phosphoenolpyruvate synthase/pyruvate phosphate dikinase
VRGLEEVTAADSDAVGGKGADPAVLAAIGQIVAPAQRLGIISSLCGQAPSANPEFTDHLVRAGIRSILVNPDAVNLCRGTVRDARTRPPVGRTGQVTRGEFDLSGRVGR